MTIHENPQFNDRSTPLDASIGRLLFMFGQLEQWQLDRIVDRVHRALPVQVERMPEESVEAEVAGKGDAAQRAVVQLLYLIAAQTYADILFALTYAETLAMMKGANYESQGVAH